MHINEWAFIATWTIAGVIGGVIGYSWRGYQAERGIHPDPDVARMLVEIERWRRDRENGFSILAQHHLDRLRDIISEFYT